MESYWLKTIEPVSKQPSTSKRQLVITVARALFFFEKIDSESLLHKAAATQRHKGRQTAQYRPVIQLFLPASNCLNPCITIKPIWCINLRGNVKLQTVNTIYETKALGKRRHPPRQARRSISGVRIRTSYPNDFQNLTGISLFEYTSVITYFSIEDQISLLEIWAELWKNPYVAMLEEFFKIKVIRVSNICQRGSSFLQCG